MKVLFIGGTGTISAAISRQILDRGWNLFLLNRCNRNDTLDRAGKAGKLVEIPCDIRSESEESIIGKVKAALTSQAGTGQNQRFDLVADFIAFTPDHLEKDYRIFKGLCNQYIFISSASAYQKPLSSYLITESTPLANPFWEYSRNKIACEESLMEKYRNDGFPLTIVRPSHTYDERNVPLGVHGNKGSWQVVKRMLDGKAVIIHGDGTSLWTMTHSNDFARAFIGLMGNIRAIGEAVQITSDESLNWNQIYSAIAAALNVQLKAIHVSSDFLAQAASPQRGPYDFTGGLIGDKANTVVFDNAKLKRLVPGFCAQVRFDQGIRETLDYVLSHRECQNEDPEFDAWCDMVIAAQEKALREIQGG
jgi:nucleoside-diphosphate-sugar epimerase